MVCFCFLAKDNLSQPKQKYYKTIDEQVHQAFRWGIDDFTENQPVATAKIWNDTTKVDFFYHGIRIVLNEVFSADSTKPITFD